MKPTNLLFVFVVALCLPAFAPRTDAQTLYERLILSAGGSDSLRSLALWEDQRVTGDGALFAWLKSRDPLIRLRAVEVIARIGDAQDVTHLIPMVKDPDPRVQRTAIWGLGQLGAPEGVSALKTLMTNSRPEEMALVTESLGKIGGPDALEILLGLLRDFSGRTREEAALALAHAADEAGVNSLMLAIHDPDNDVAQAAIYALGRTETTRADEKLQVFLTHEDVRVRANAALALGRHKASSAVGALTMTLSDKDMAVVCNAAWALGEIRREDPVHQLGSLLATNPSHRVRKAAADALGGIGKKSGKDYVIRALTDESVSVRCAAIVALGKILGAEVAMFTDQMRGDGSRLVRAAAIEALGDGNCKKRFEELEKIATAEKDPLMRSTAAEALGKIEKKEAGPVLVTLLNDSDWVVVAVAVNAIGVREYKDAVPALIDKYGRSEAREDASIRLEILRVLTRFDSLEGRDIAIAALSDPDWRIREKALELLEHLGAVPEVVPTTREINTANFDRARRRFVDLPTGLRHAVITTPHGDIEIELYGDDAPAFVTSFIELANRGDYNNRIFHRMEAYFVIQGGDPRGDGWGDCGELIPSQFSMRRYSPGTVGVPHDGKDTGGCQLFITHRASHHLDGRHTVFGRVTKGMAVVNLVDRGDAFSVRVVD